MAETKMTPNEVLSLLNKMDEEHRTYMSMFGARQYVRDVIMSYQEANKLLTELNTRKDNLTASIASLGKQLEDGIAKVNVEIENKREAGNRELETVTKALENAKDAFQVISKSLSDKEVIGSARITELNLAISEKEASLKKITDAFDSFKATHGMK